MCFSAQASFIASGILAVTGIASIYLARNRAMLLLAVIPLVFALQQFAEGVIWLTHTAHSAAFTTALYVFLFIAMVWWPIWLPTTAYLIEKSFQRKRLILACMGCGAAFGITALYNLIMHGAHANLTHNHVAYVTAPMPFAFMYYLYFIAVIAPLVLTNNRSLWIMAAGTSAAYIVSAHWFPLHIASVWCFFAALVSSCILLTIWYDRRRAS